MKIASDNKVLKLLLEWHDIDELKAGNLVAERYDSEHKCNLSCIPESLFAENWTETGSLNSKTEFNEYLHDFFIQIPVFDVRNQFVSSTTIQLCPNPFYNSVHIIFPG